MSVTTNKPTLRSICKFKVTQIIDHTAQIRELFLELVNFDEFNFKAGQFVMLHVPTSENTKPALRAYSIASTDISKKSFKLIFKYVQNGIASEFVWKLSAGDILDFTGPFGKVFFQEPPTEQVVFLNTGSGVSQHFSFLESKLKDYPNLKCFLYFGLRSESDIYYESNLKKLQEQYPNFIYEYVLSRPSETWNGKKGYVQNFISELNYTTIPTTFYLCGNGAMIKDVKNQLINVDQIPKQFVWAEAFD